MEDISYSEDLVISRFQMENLIGHKFINGKHWEIFQLHIFIRPKPTLFEMYRWSEMEYLDIISR